MSPIVIGIFEKILPAEILCNPLILISSTIQASSEAKKEDELKKIVKIII